jgi:hypothetical protein
MAHLSYRHTHIHILAPIHTSAFLFHSFVLLWQSSCVQPAKQTLFFRRPPLVTFKQTVVFEKDLEVSCCKKVCLAFREVINVRLSHKSDVNSIVNAQFHKIAHLFLFKLNSFALHYYFTRL